MTMKTFSLLFLSSSVGRVAALSMMGKATDIKAVPYFWTAMFGKSIRYAGTKQTFTLTYSVNMLMKNDLSFKYNTVAMA